MSTRTSAAAAHSTMTAKQKVTFKLMCRYGWTTAQVSRLFETFNEEYAVEYAEQYMRRNPTLAAKAKLAAWCAKTYQPCTR